MLPLSLTRAVSGLHARIQKKEGSLLVTDLDSTNGTFIDDRKLRPGVAAAVSPGSCITFGTFPRSRHTYVCLNFRFSFSRFLFSSPISGFSWGKSRNQEICVASRMSNDDRKSFLLWIVIVLAQTLTITWISFSLIGDTHLAMFEVSKLQTAVSSTEAGEPEEKPELENSEGSTESAAWKLPQLFPTIPQK